jgi:hypothetical protein
VASSLCGNDENVIRGSRCSSAEGNCPHAFFGGFWHLLARTSAKGGCRFLLLLRSKKKKKEKKGGIQFAFELNFCFFLVLVKALPVQVIGLPHFHVVHLCWVEEDDRVLVLSVLGIHKALLVLDHLSKE